MSSLTAADRTQLVKRVISPQSGGSLAPQVLQRHVRGCIGDPMAKVAAGDLGLDTHEQSPHYFGCEPSGIALSSGNRLIVLMKLFQIHRQKFLERGGISFLKLIYEFPPLIFGDIKFTRWNVLPAIGAEFIHLSISGS